MTERFEIFPQNVAKDGTLIIIQKGLKLYNISDVVDLLNNLNKENEALKNFVKVNFSDMMAEKMEKELKNDRE